MRCCDHDLAVHDAAVRQRCDQTVVQFGKVAIERARVPALDEDAAAAAKHDCAEAVPFRLEEESVAVRNLFGQFGQHRFDRRVERKAAHARSAVM